MKLSILDMSMLRHTLRKRKKLSELEKPSTKSIKKKMPICYKEVSHSPEHPI